MNRADKLSKSAIEELRKLKEMGDPEAAHSKADDVLCNLLKELGFNDVVTEYAKVEKWYA